MEVGIYDKNYNQKFLNESYFYPLAFNSYPNVYENFNENITIKSYINFILFVLILILIYILYNSSKK